MPLNDKNSFLKTPDNVSTTSTWTNLLTEQHPDSRLRQFKKILDNKISRLLVKGEKSYSKINECYRKNAGTNLLTKSIFWPVDVM